MTAEDEDWSNFSLMALFRLEVETQTAELTRNLLAVEQASDELELRNHLEILMRAAHSIKGAARIVQLSPAVEIAHALEDRFVAALEKQAPLSEREIDALLAGIDLLSRLGLLEEEDLSTNLSAYAAAVSATVDTISVAAESSAVKDAGAGAKKTAGELAKKVDKQITELAPSEVSELEVSVPELSKLEASVPEVSRLDLSEYEQHKFEQSDISPLEASDSNSLSVQEDDSWGLVERDLLPAQVTFDQSASDQSDSGQFSPAQSDFSQSVAETAERTIRIRAENLSRLIGLAGESLVEANWLEPFGQSLLMLKQQQQEVLALLSRSVDGCRGGRDFGRDRDESASLAIAALQAMQSAHQLLDRQLDDLSSFSQRFSHLSDGLYREVVASHMCAFEEGTRGYHRLVRDLAKSLDKQVVLKIDGLATQVDRDILSKLDAPLVHLMTNAVVHGIEPAAQRRARGKPEKGMLRIEAVHRSGMLVVSVSDDGSGVDVASLRQKIVEKGLTTAAIAQQMQLSELLEFLFLPGFSTAGSVDALAGRGYGLDLARTMAQSVGGSLRIFSKLGSGTMFRFQLPLTLSVMRSLLFEVANETYALSLARIERVLLLSPEQIYYSENRPYFVVSLASNTDKESVSLVYAGRLLGISQFAKKTEKICVVVIGEAGSRYGIQVDRFIEEKDLVVRPLDSRLGKIENVSAAAITEKGEPILILDVSDVLRSAEKIAAAGAEVSSLVSISGLEPSELESSKFGSSELKPSQLEPEVSLLASQQIASQQKRVLVVDDSMTVRAIEQKLLENRGYAVDIAVDGAEGWNRVRMTEYDLVITDVDMPRMSGIELIKQMRDYRSTQQIPVIVVSYKDRKEDQMAGLEAGANYYLTKSSFHDDGLINAVVDLIGP